MTTNDQVVGEIVNAILAVVKNRIASARFDRTRFGIVNGVNGSMYTVRIDGAEYSVPSASGAYSVGDKVLVLFIENNISKRYIIGKG